MALVLPHTVPAFFLWSQAVASPRWDPLKVLKLDDPASCWRCIGYAPSKGRRCERRIAIRNRNTASAMLAELALLEVSSPRVDELLHGLAVVLLCLGVGDHRKQASNVVEQWKYSIREYQTRQQNLVQSPGTTSTFSTRSSSTGSLISTSVGLSTTGNTTLTSRTSTVQMEMSSTRETSWTVGSDGAFASTSSAHLRTRIDASSHASETRRPTAARQPSFDASSLVREPRRIAAMRLAGARQTSDGGTTPPTEIARPTTTSRPPQRSVSREPPSLGVDQSSTESTPTLTSGSPSRPVEAASTRRDSDGNDSTEEQIMPTVESTQPATVPEAAPPAVSSPPVTVSEVGAPASSTHDGRHVWRKPIEQECPICLEPLLLADERVVWCQAQCGTNFHGSCIDMNRVISEERDVPERCGMCRADWKRDASDDGEDQVEIKEEDDD